MFPDERSPHEPDEPDLGPKIPEVTPPEVTPPDVAPPDEGFFGPSGVDPGLVKAFWSLVLLLNVGLLTTSVGLMLVGFRGRWQLGGVLVLVGIVALVRAITTFRQVRRDEERWTD